MHNRQIGVFLIFFLAAFTLYAFSLLSEEALPPFLEKPSSVDQALIEEKISSYQAEHSSAYQAENFYNLSLLYIQRNKLDQAEKTLQQALSLNPSFTLAKLQLGWLFLWKGQLSKAEEWLQKVLIDLPCDKRALSGLEKIAHEFEKEEKSQNKALTLYRQLIRCLPDNADYLFYLGRLLLRMDKREEAEQVLQKCLTIAPQYSDADVLIGDLYFRQKKFEQAEKIFKRYPQNLDAKLGLARISLQKEDYETAERHLSPIVQQRPNDPEIYSLLSNLHFATLEFKKAKKENELLLKKFGPNDQIYRTLFEIKSHTDPSLILTSTYTVAKEDDPSLKAPVVRDFYFHNTATVLIPLSDRWRLGVQAFSGFQKEKDIFPPVGINYHVPYVGAKMLSSWFFHRNWHWDVFCALLRGWNEGHQVNYPFLNTTRVQPGTAFFYTPTDQFLVLDFHFEDFLIKDFARMESKYLTIKYLDGLYKRRFNLILHPEITGSLGWIFYDDHFHNVQNYQLLALSFGPSWLSETLHLFYNFEHRGFEHLNQNYYSFKKQYLHVIGVRLNHEWPSGLYFEMFYFHNWKFTYKLFQPIGNFIFVAAKQKLTANKIDALIGYRFKDRFRFEVGGHYFRDTLPYRDWNIRGNFIWEF